MQYSDQPNMQLIVWFMATYDVACFQYYT